MTQASPPTTEENLGRTRWFALGVVAAGLSMIVLDGTIVGVALPRIIEALHLDLTDAQWVNSLYSMVFAALLLTFGRLGDRFGRRGLFVIGVVLFVTGSVTAALAGAAPRLRTPWPSASGRQRAGPSWCRLPSSCSASSVPSRCIGQRATRPSPTDPAPSG